MAKLKHIRIQQSNGSYSAPIPIGADAVNVSMKNGSNLQETIGNINPNNDGNITTNLTNLKNSIQTLNDTKVNKSQVGSPAATNTAAGMTDTSKIYIYTGNQDGYINGNWYFYNGSTWESGGIYNSAGVQTDDSLSIRGMAADAEAVGQALSQMDAKMENVSIDVDDLGLYQDPDTGYVYPTYRGTSSQNGIPLAASGGGGGGGGGDINNAVLTVQNTTGWLSKTISKGSDCAVSITWSSLEDEISTGNGSARITVNGIVKGVLQIHQGAININIGPYLNVGNNVVKVRISDVYDNGQTITFNIVVADFSISSTFTTTTPFTEEITFPFTPVGEASKKIYFILDGIQIGTLQTSASNRQLTYKIPAQNHGAHTLRCYFEVELNEETIRSNELYFEFMFVQEGNNSSIITSSFNKTSVDQFSSVVIPYKVYSPVSSSVNIELYLNDGLVSTQTVGSEEQNFSFRANTVGTNTFKIQAGNVYKIITFNVIESDIQVAAITEDLALYLHPHQRSNSEPVNQRSVWSYQNISANLQNFNWRTNGWLLDNDGVNVLRVNGDARITIPYKIFATDFKTTGKTIQFEFATREVADYNAPILSCYSGNIGLQLTSQSVLFKGAQTEISTLYKDNEHIRVSFVIEKQNENRLILIYINGIMSRAIQYASGERFTQLSPVDISIGSSSCGIDLYNIRIYNNNLNRREVLNNWIADTQVGATLLDRYTHNNVYDEYDNITISNLPNDLPYMILEAPELSQYKGDKKTISGSYTDPVSPSKSFTFNGCQLNVQGTSSAVYYRKNYDLQFKNGFITNSGTIDNYALRPGSIPFNRFVIKADVASSESTNNTGLTMFYNDTCVYVTPEERANSKVRWGIQGIPIAVFWYNTDTQETSFLGKYNFNLPKRAPAPYGYSGNMESWQVERNNSANVKFQDDDFEALSWNEVDQVWYPTWYDDFEARFPSDEWRDYSKIKELISWVKSTWREQATNETLPEPVTYRLNTTITVNDYSSDSSYTVVNEIDSGGNNTGYKIFTFTKDTPAYRLTKFKAELSDYVEIRSAVFYYLFTELFLMIDSRAKNMFIGFKGSAIEDENRVMDRKAVFEPYDMDTAIGTNNSGVLMFGYYLEDTDKVSSIISGGEGGSEANVFNAQDSVFWVNLRDSCRSEITQMYRDLRSGTVKDGTSISVQWSYKIVKERFENHQAKWPEAIFNEDAYLKYLIPLVDPVTVDESTGQLIRTDRYLTMLQGSKEEQRKWWLYNRFRYLDSKFTTGEASSNRISARFFNNGTLTITPAVDMYVGVYFGGGTTVALKRTTANTPVSFPYQAGTTAQEMETWIDSGDMIADVGDLSVFYPNEIEFSKATKLKRLQIGSATSGYSNTNLNTLDVSNCTLLEYIDVRNCPNLAITINLQGSPGLKEAYFDNTAITGVDLVDGCPIETLHLPATVTALTLLNLNKLEEFVIPSYSNITRLFLANMDSSVVNPITVLQGLPSNALINIQGLYLDVNSSTEIDTFYNLLDSMNGVTREKNSSGNWIYTEYDDARTTVSGTIHIAALTGAQIAAYQARYPYITIDADGVSSTVTYMNYDGTSTITTETVVKNAQNPHPNATYSGHPSRTSTAQYDYTFAGWSTTPNGSAEANAQKDIQGDRILYAAYTFTVRTYTVYWVNNGSTIETDANVPYGATPSYNGSTPTKDGQTSIGWLPDPTQPITGNTTFTAQYLPVYTVTFKNDTGSTTLDTQNVVQGQTATYGGSTPTSSEDASLAFLGWATSANSHTANAVLTNVQSNMTVYAAFESAIEVAEITDSWDTIIANIDNGIYSTKYKIGNYKPLDLGTEGTINMQIVAMDADELASGGYAPLTFLGMELLATKRQMNSVNTPIIWPNSPLRSTLESVIKPLIPSSVRARINSVVKTYYDSSSADSNKTKSSVDSLWIPSLRELAFPIGDTLGTSGENTGVIYSQIYSNNASRIKTLSETATAYWLRSFPQNTFNFNPNNITVESSGLRDISSSNASLGVCLGFCLGLEQETITDDWSTILANQNYATDYSIGDTKMLDLGTEGKHLMEIVAFNEDDRADGNGKAGITWISKTLLNTTHKMNDTSTTTGGWTASGMRSYLKNTIKPLIPATVRNAIVEVSKIQTIYNGTHVSNGQTSNDDVWIPSIYELYASNNFESLGACYEERFRYAFDKDRIKTWKGNKFSYWTRTVNNSSSYRYIVTNGDDSSSSANYQYGVTLGFCTNVQPEIADSWDTIISHIDDGTYVTRYKVGQYKPLDLGTEGIINMQIAAIDADELASGGYAPLSFVGMNLLSTSKEMHDVNSNTLRFENTNLYNYLNSTIFNLIPSTVSQRICTVNKISRRTYNESYTSALKLWIPSKWELDNSISEPESTGINYGTVYSNDTTRIKKSNTGNAFRYWTRSHGSVADSAYWCSILNTGAVYPDGYTVSTKCGIALGFCLGLEPEE